MDSEYADAVARYLSEREAAEAELRAARETYRAETEALDAEVRAARERRGEAERAAAEAAALAVETEEAVGRLWRALEGFVGARRAGPPPEAAPASGEDAETVRARLARAGRLLELARQGELPIEAPRHTEPVATGVGAALGAAAVGLAFWLLTADPGGATALRRALAAATLFGGVAAAPLALGVWLSWQYRVRPRPTQTIACVAGALVATCALAGVFLRGT